jgi:hypothetical protein
MNKPSFLSVLPAFMGEDVAGGFRRPGSSHAEVHVGRSSGRVDIPPHRHIRKRSGIADAATEWLGRA